jgi:hypothetical protein
MDRRDETVGRIARKLEEHQRRMANLAVQLQALYEGRKEDVVGLLKEGRGSSGGGGAEVTGGRAGGVDGGKGSV